MEKKIPIWHWLGGTIFLFNVITSLFFGITFEGYVFICVELLFFIFMMIRWENKYGEGVRFSLNE